MRVAHILKELDPAYGGLTTVPLLMSRAIANAGVDVELWTADSFAFQPPRPETVAGSLTLVERPGPSGRFDAAFVERFRADLERVDVVHLHAFWGPQSARFVRLCHEVGTPTVQTMHGMLMTYPMNQKRPKKRIWLRLVGGRQLKGTSVVHMLNREETAQSLAQGYDFRVFELPNGVETEEFASLPERGTWRASEPTLADKLVILSMGRLHSIKGPELLLGAFLDLAQERDDIALVMAGPEEGMGATLDAMLADHPAADRVRLPGLVGGELRLALLADADIFAQCSRHETASMSVIEGAFAGRAMLVTDKCNCPEVGEADAGLVVGTTRDAVRDGLRRLIDERDRLAERGANARRLVEERFTLDAVTPKLIEHYERLVAGESYPLASQLLRS